MTTQLEEIIKTSESMTLLNRLLQQLPLAHHNSMEASEKAKYISMIKNRIEYLRRNRGYGE